MGEVYKARDTRLDRIVAIKVLPTHLADRAELRERFEREARTIASLNHPHICTLHDIGHQDGIDFLVMEYLEGGTLAQRLLKGPLPLEQVFQYAIEIADALDKAHRKGVTHRDLKPGNIMLTKSGTKLLDFGLAKLRQIGAPAAPLSQLPTASSAITAEGTILGTLQYMAPEQLEGKKADARTDIFAFGAVVYEMATGKKAFEGQSQASVISAIMSSDPIPMSSLQPMTPPALDRVVKKCLAKEPEKRWQVASDLCDELKWIVESSGQTAAISPAVPAYKSNRKTLAWVAAGVVACVIVGIAAWMLKPAPLRPVTRFAMSLPPGLRLLGGQPIAISPDGKLLVYAAGESTAATQLYVRAMDGLEARPFPGPEGKWQISTGGGLDPKWSRNGKELFYRTGDSKIMVATYAASADSFHADKPQLWSPGQFTDLGLGIYAFDLHPDGKRFAVLKTPGTEGATVVNKVSFIFNFFDELRSKLPPGK
jgi:eukaryotic-like serine/threonine-protein kinase